MISSPVACAIDSCSSNRSVHSEFAHGGRNTVQIMKSLEMGKAISAHKDSILEISNI